MTEAIILTEHETRALAMLIVVRQLEDAPDWLLWEDVPLLDAAGHEQILDAVEDVRFELSRQLRHFEMGYDVDAREVYGRVS